MNAVSRGGQRGFTLYELIAVMLVMGILGCIAVPSFKRSQLRARETVLAEDLYQMRKAIDSYFSDKGKYPDNLEELKTEKYLRDIPLDPFTRERDSWECVPPEPTESGHMADGSCFDVRSGSSLVGFNQIPYRQW